METSIEQLSPVDYNFDVKATADQLADRIDQAMRKRRGTLTMKGFRPGKVPLSLVKKMHGKGIAFEVAEAVIQERFDEEIIKGDTFTVFGPLKIETLEYEPFGDLHAVIHFGVRPEVVLADLSKTQLEKLTHEVADEEVEEEFEMVRVRHAHFHVEDRPATEEDFVLCDFQRLDDESGAPLIGEKQENITVYLANPNTVAEMKTALVGRSAEEVVKVTLPGPEGAEEDEVRPRIYEVTVKEVRHRHLPDVTEEFAGTVSGGRASDADSLRQWLRSELEQRWADVLRDEWESRIRRAVADLHDFAVPGPVVETYLDYFIQELAQENKGEVPENFDEELFRENNRESAAELVRWLLIRDTVVDEKHLEVSPDEMSAEFEEMGRSRSVPGDMMRRVLEAYNPDGVSRIERRLLDSKVYAELASRMEVVDKPWQDAVAEEESEAATEEGA